MLNNICENIGSVNLKLICLSSVILFYSCSDDLPTSANNANSKRDIVSSKPVVKRSHNAGIIESRYSFEFTDFIEDDSSRTVESIRSSCGCTASDLAVDDVLTASSSIVLTVSPRDAELGEHEQSVTVDCSDGSQIVFQLTYDYRPLPFVSPEYIVFRSEDPTKRIRVTFPGNKNPTISRVYAPMAEVSAEILEKLTDEVGILDIDLTYDYEKFEEAVESVILIETESQRKPTIRIPFLALKN